MKIKTCTKCHTEKEFKKYGKYYPSWCTDCRREAAQKERRDSGIESKVVPKVIDNEHKECLKCHQILHIDLFDKNPRGRLKRSAYCKICFSQYIKDLRDSDLEHYRHKTKESTQRYRDNHREHWRGLHRINQYNRKNKIKVQSDGTVTEQFMKELYATEICYWCQKPTLIENRTAEHVIPLDKGGVHGVSNLKMACLSCNSSKLNFN